MPADDAWIPQDLDAEMAVLGAMMMDRNVVEDVVRIIGNGDAFFTPAHSALFGVLAALYAKGSPMDLVVVSAALKHANKLEAVGGHSYMLALADSFTDTANATDYAQIVAEHHLRRQLLKCSYDLRRASCNLAEEADVLPERFISELAEFEGRADEQAADVHEALDTLCVADRTKVYIKTDFRSFDFEIGGIEREALTIIASRPSVGKSALALNLAREAIAQDERVAFFSLEMSRKSLGWRLVSMCTGRPSSELRHAASADELAIALDITRGQFPKRHLFLFDRTILLREIVPLARSLVRSQGVSMIFVDYLQLCRTGMRFDRRDLELAHMTRAFKELARDSGAAIVVMSQLSRQGSNVKPQLHHLRESGAIEQDADVVWMLWRDEAKDPGSRERIKVFIRKNRNGPTMGFGLSFHRPTQCFSLAKPVAVVQKETEDDKQG